MSDDDAAAAAARRALRRVRIRLTPGQRERVKAQTGRDMEVLEREDVHGTLRVKMPTLTPPEVELMAIRKARRLNDEEEAERVYILGLAEQQDEEARRLREMAEVEREVQKDIKRQEKQTAAKFKLLAEGKQLPDEDGKVGGKRKVKPAKKVPARKKSAAKRPGTKRS